MTELSKIQELVDEELKEANKKYPLFLQSMKPMR